MLALHHIPGKDFHPWFNGGYVLGFFLFVTGYFMTASFERKRQNNLLDPANAHVSAWQYFWTRVKGLMPASILGFIVVFSIRNYAIKTPLSQISLYLIKAGYEILGLYQIGMNGYTEGTGLEGTGLEGLKGALNAVAESRMGAAPAVLWNGPSWYISAIIITSVIIYYVLVKNRDFFLGFFVPFMIIATYGYTGFAQESGFQRTQLHFLGLPTNIMRVTGGICIGVLMYYVVQWIKEKQIVEKHKAAWNTFAVLLSAFVSWTVWAGISWSEIQNNLFLIPFTVVVIVGQDPISKFLSDQLGKFSVHVGQLSLYIYISHWAYITLFQTAPFSKKAYVPMAFTYIGLCLLTGYVLMLIDTKLIQPKLFKRA
ncbi:acyltransferase family protein [Streptococcus caprae]